MKFFSKNPKKQRRFAKGIGLHLRKNNCTCHLSKELRKETGKRALCARQGDKVKVMRGKHSGKDGKILRVDLKKGMVFVEKIVRKKSDGKEIQLPIRASNALLVDLDRSDERRFKAAKEKKPAKESAGKKAKAGEKAKDDIWADEKNENSVKVK